MQDFAKQNIILGISGGIAAYKSAFLARELMRFGAEVRVVMTRSAQQFITPLTLQALTGHEVRVDLFDAKAEQAMGHIELARWGDCLLIAPASANCLAKLAHGLADDLLTTLYLAFNKKVVVCPAMNEKMWAHPASQANCLQLQSRGALIVGPSPGIQACGDEGFGRMCEIPEIISALRLFDLSQQLAEKHVLITAGPTREAIDPVRYLSNYSSGKMGYAMAEAAMRAGASVTLVSGPTALPPPVGVNFVAVNSAKEMLEAVLLHLKPQAIFIGAAAVADYGVQTPQMQKIKKQNHPRWSFCLDQNPDILSAVVNSEKASFVVGFAAETQDVVKYATQKLKDKKLDMIIANQVSQSQGFECDENRVTVLTPEHQIELPLMHKTRLAGKLIHIIAEHNK